MVVKLKFCARVLVVVATLLVGAAILPGKAEARYLVTDGFEAVSREAAPSVAIETSPGDYIDGRLPGVVFAVLILGVALYAAWKLPMSQGDSREVPEQDVPAIIPPGGRDPTGVESLREPPPGSLAGELRSLRRAVEEQERRLAAVEEENLKLRRKVEAPANKRPRVKELRGGDFRR